MSTATKFKRIELLIKDSNSIQKLEFYNSVLVITGDYIIIVSDERDSNDIVTSNIGKIYNLNQISAYKTHLT